MTMDYTAVLGGIVNLVKQVGAFQKENLLTPRLHIDTKSNDIDLVTEIDKASDAMISDYIKANFPDHALLTEESGESGPESDYRWVVDPLDGTTNFAQGLPIFCISIALQYQGETVLGVVYQPAMDDLFTAIRGRGAYRNGKKMAVAEKRALGAAVLSTGFPYDQAEHPANNYDYFTAMSPKVRAVRRFGAAAYDLALVADGRFDGHWELNLSPWDIAAGLLLIEEAGGKILRFRNDRKESIIVGNEILCKLILEVIQAVDAQ